MIKNEECINVNNKIFDEDIFIKDVNFERKRYGTLKNYTEEKVQEMTINNIRDRSKTFSNHHNYSKNGHIHHLKNNLINENSTKRKATSVINTENQFKGKPFKSTINPLYKNQISSVSDNNNSSLNSPISVNKIYRKKTEFFINNNKKNEDLNLNDNTISTSKYNFYTFIPKSLFYQFLHLSNIYFLITAIIQSIPIVSPLTSATAIVPLIFVLSVSMIRELIEDLSRRRDDSKNNKEKVWVYRENNFINVYSKTLKPGEFILLNENNKIPADMLLLDSGLERGVCYVETSSLDGEKTLKPKISNKRSCDCFKFYLEKYENFENIKSINFDGKISVDPPNANLNQINGNVEINIREKKVNFNFSTNEFLLKSSVLRNTKWVFGIIIYTGKNNKIILNSKKPKVKVSKIEKQLNMFLIIIFVILYIFCSSLSFLHYHFYKKNEKFYKNFIKLTIKPALESFLTFFTYFLLLNTMLPISLIVTMEIIKIIQGFFMEWDLELYSKKSNTFCKVKTVSINEELGNVNIIFSDKTGTLTNNILKFKYFIINDKCYLFKGYNFKINHLDDFHSNDTEKENFPKIVELEESYKNQIYDEDISKNSQFSSNQCLNPFSMSSTKNNKYLNHQSTFSNTKKEIQRIIEFWKALALANECIVIEEKNEMKYSGCFPDDIELVKAAAFQGYKLLKTTVDKKILRIHSRNIIKYEVLKVFGFSSERKRMSIIVRSPSGKIKMYTKGADCEIMKRLSIKNNNLNYINAINKYLQNFSENGYRTLMIAYKIIDEKVYKEWIHKFHKDEKYNKNNTLLLEQYFDSFERDLELLGGTVVEDQLQDEVPETIQDILNANIKIWVLTGDKKSTADIIGRKCKLINEHQKVFKLYLCSEKNVEKIINEFFNQFTKFINECRNKYFNDLNFDLFSVNSNALLQNLPSKKNIYEPFSVLIESPILCDLFLNEQLTNKFFSICQHANTVIFCRVSPSQKSEIIKKFRKFNKKLISLAIGDGGNDVAMIMEANIGVGILGEEGMAAAQASDFAIGEFKNLRRLLFYHGKNNNGNISKLIIYFFYKNFIFTLIQFHYAFFCLSSGQTIFDDWYITYYNLIFTAFPLMVAALTDNDFIEKNGKTVNLSFLYRESQKNKEFTLKKFIFILIYSFYLSFVICSSESSYFIIDKGGHSSNLWFISLKIYTSILIIVSENLLMKTKYIVLYLPLAILITTFLFFIVFLIINHYGLIFKFNSKASIFNFFSILKYYCVIFIVFGFSFIIDYVMKVQEFYFGDNLYSKYLKNQFRNEAKKKRATLSIKLNKNKSRNIFKKSNQNESDNSKIQFEVQNYRSKNNIKIYRNSANEKNLATCQKNLKIKSSFKCIKNIRPSAGENLRVLNLKQSGNDFLSINL